MKISQKLIVSDNNRFLTKENGASFFWLGDTAWELFHKASKKEAFDYLKTRAYQGFNVVQVVALAELDGIRTGNHYGQKPLFKNEAEKYDPSMPALKDEEYDYWDHVDYVVETACNFGIYIALLPTWGDKYNTQWGVGPEIFNEKNAEKYGQFLGERYAEQKNVII